MTQLDKMPAMRGSSPLPGALSPVVLDLETRFSKDFSVTTLGNQAYARDPRREVYLLILHAHDFRWIGHPKDAPWEKLVGRTLLHHNKGFDRAQLEQMVLDGIAPAFVLDLESHCTANMCAYFGLPRALAKALEVEFGIKHDKTVRNQDMKGVGHAELEANPVLKAKVYEYAAKDGSGPLMLWDKYGHLWPDFEKAISNETYRMCAAGVPVDVERIKRHIATLKQAVAVNEARIPWARDYAVLSVKALAKECQKLGIPAPTSLAQDSEECEVWEEKYGETVPLVKYMRNWRRANALLKKFETMLARVGPDGRMSYSLLYYGASTGRFAGGGGGFNCVTGDHEVLTPHGWMSIRLWEPEVDQIAQWDAGRVDFVTAKKVSHEHTGFVVQAESSDVSLVATEDHRVLHLTGKSTRVVPAASLINRQLNIPTSGVVGTTDSSWTDDEIRLAVALAADGHEVVKRGKKNGAVTFGFEKERKAERLCDLLRACSVQFTALNQTDPNTATYRYYIPCGHWPVKIAKGYGPWVLGLSARQMEVLLDELVYWDGHANNRSGATEFYTSIRAQAEWVKTVAHLCGRCASLNAYPCSTSATGEKCVVYFKKSSVKEFRNGAGNTAAELVEFQGTVYCPQVPSSYWLVRHNGKIHVTGNCQNLPKEPLMFDADWNILDPNDPAEKARAVPEHTCDMRACIVAPTGKKLACVDFAQIEARVTPWVAGDRATLERIRPPAARSRRFKEMLKMETSVYQVHAELSMNWKGEEADPTKWNLKKADKILYALAKARVLGLGFGCGWAKFIELARKMLDKETFTKVFAKATNLADRAKFLRYLGRLKFPFKKADAIPQFNAIFGVQEGELSYEEVMSNLTFVRNGGMNLGDHLNEWLTLNEASRDVWVNSWLQVMDYRAKNPKIVELWKRMGADLESAVGTDYSVVLPSGRVLYYHNVELRGDSIVVQTTKGEKHSRAYGPLMVENLVQAAARDLLCYALLRLRDAGFEVIMHVHDEIIVIVNNEEEADIVTQIMCENPPWARSLPIGAEPDVTTYYRKG